MLSAVIIILREVLEAALIISVLLAVSEAFVLGRKWIFPALCFGLLGSVFFAGQIGALSEKFDGVGQEITNAFLLLLVILLLTGVLFWMTRASQDVGSSQRQCARIRGVLTAVVVIAIVREGAEIFIYSSIFPGRLDAFLPAFIGGSIGAGIGASIGALIYYFLVSLSPLYFFRTTAVILALISGGMAGQIALNLMQAGWLPSQTPLWDTAQLLPETSILGQLLYALLGYEATPTPIQIGFHVLTVIGMGFIVFLVKQNGHHSLAEREEEESP